MPVVERENTQTPTVWHIARRPRWIATLLLALTVAGVFAALGAWQFESGIASIAPDNRDTETAVPLDEVAQPQSPVPTVLVGQRVSVTAELVPGDLLVLSNRVNDSVAGFWVVGHLVTERGVSLAVALGWAAEKEQADAAVARLADGHPPLPYTGRYLTSEAPQLGDFESGERAYLSVGALINDWQREPNGVYGGYLVASDPPEGLVAIDSPPPISQVQLNWLNLFYAVEWALFAGFAVFLWWRLVRDAWESELEELRELEAEALDGAKLN